MEAQIAKLFGQIIRRLRTDAGYSQEAFAFHCKVDRSYMGDIERGSAQASIQVAYRIARGLKISLASLFLQLDKEIKAERRRQREARRVEKEAKAAASDTETQLFTESKPKPTPRPKLKTALAGSRRQPRKPVQG